MMDYLITCTAISLSALLASILLKNAPARISFYLLVFALCSWLIPWQLVPDTLSDKVQLDSWFELTAIDLQSPVITAQQVSNARQTLQTQAPWYHQLTWGQLFAVTFVGLLLIGAGLFLLRLQSYLATIQRLNNKVIQGADPSSLGQGYRVKVTQLHTPAIATGLFQPTIWIDSQLLQRPELDSVLLHEATHIRQGDIRWLWLICLTESLFWWNPLCRLLADQTRKLLELSCDESCYRQLQQKYQFDLASLLLKPLAGSSKQSLAGSPILNIVNDKDFNLLRVKLLNKEKVMKLKHLVILMAAVSVSSIAAVQISDNKAGAAVTNTAQYAELSEAFKTQQALLLKAAAKAKSADPAELKQVVANIQAWQNNRTELAAREEQRMKLGAFTLLAHVQHKLGQYQELMTTFEAWYPAGTEVPFFLRNFTANTYLQLKSPDLALQELATLQQEIGDQIRPGSLYLQALAYTEKADYTNALKTLSHKNLVDDQSSNLLRYYIYSQQNDVVQRDQIKATLPKGLASQPATMPKAGLPGSPLLQLLPAV